MTAAQKKVADNFKKALAIRKKTGCSLKDAFAKVYGKKTTATKKVVKKKVAKKRIASVGSSKVASNLGQRLYDNASNTMGFGDELGELIGVARDMGYSFSQTKVAIKYIVDGVFNFYEDEF